MAVHGIQSADAAAGIGLTQAELRLSGVWFLHSVSLQNEDVAAGEPGLIMMQFNTDAYEADRPWHPLEQGMVRSGAPMVEPLGFIVRGTCLFVGQIDHVAAAAHRLTVLAWKVKDR